MTQFYAMITQRGDPNRQIQTAGMVLRPERWKSDDQGGPADADVRVEGSAQTITDVFNWLGCGVEIFNDEGAMLWSGQIEGIDLTYGPWQYDIDLADVANRVRAAYTAYTAGGDVASYLTDWVDDEFSQSVYGIRERSESLSGHADAQAAASYLARLLAAVGLPSAVRGGGDGSYRATLRCVGLREELARQYHENFEGRTEYDPGGSVVDHVLGWRMEDNSAGFSNNGDGDTGGYSSFDAKLPPGAVNQQFEVTNSLSNNAIYTIVERAAETVQTLDTTNDGAGFRWDGSSSSKYLVEPMTEGLGFLGVGQQIDIDITTDATGYYGYESSDWGFEGLFNVRETGSERVYCDWDATRSASEVDHDQGGVHDHPKEADGYLHGTLTAAAYLRVSPAPAADELQQNATTFVVTTVGERMDQLVNVPVAGGGPLWKVGIPLKRVGTPTDTVRVSVWEDSGGSFGAMIDQGWIPASDVGVDQSMVWCEMENAGTNEVTDSTSVHIVVERTIDGTSTPSTYDTTNYWVVGLIEAEDDLYEEEIRLYDGTSWATRPTVASMPFRLWAGEDVTARIESLVDAYRVSINGVDVAEEAGVLVNPYNDEERKALDVIRSLLAKGTADGAGLVLEMVEPRRMVVRKRPTEDDRRRVRINTLRRPELVAGGAISPGVLFVGEWADEAGAPDQPSAVMPLTPAYLSWMEYKAASGTYDYGDDGAANRLDVGLING